MTKQELTDWALANGWQMIAGHPSLTKPSSRKEAIVRMVLKATVAAVEVKKPAGKWEKFASAAYAAVQPDAPGHAGRSGSARSACAGRKGSGGAPRSSDGPDAGGRPTIARDDERTSTASART